MVDNLKELRKKEKGETQKGRILTNDLIALLSIIRDDVSQAIINYEASITTQKASTSMDQKQARLLNEPNQPDSGSLDQGIVKMDWFGIFMIPSFFGSFEEFLTRKTLLILVSSTADEDLSRFELKFENVNAKNFEYLKDDLKTMITNVLGVSSGHIYLELTSDGVVVLTLPKSTEDQLLKLISSPEFQTKLNKALTISTSLKGITLTTVTRVTYSIPTGKMFWYFSIRGIYSHSENCDHHIRYM